MQKALIAGAMAYGVMVIGQKMVPATTKDRHLAFYSTFPMSDWRFIAAAIIAAVLAYQMRSIVWGVVIGAIAAAALVMGTNPAPAAAK